MWPFKKKVQNTGVNAFSYSQVDITERSGDAQALTASDWISTTPLNSMVETPESRGLPPLGVNNEDEVYRIASRLSVLRDAIRIPNDGVYCPICHIANVDLTRLRTPCPRCQRDLLRFGWD
jgi:hypothetical protein